MRRRRAPAAKDSAHDRLVARACRWLRGRGCRVVLPEFSTWSTSHEVPDAIGWRVTHAGARSHLVECKVSRADFLADRKKPHRVNPELGMGAYRWMMVLFDVELSELPPRWGLLRAGYGGGQVRVWKEASPFPVFARQHETSLLVQALRREEKPRPNWGSVLFEGEGEADALQLHGAVYCQKCGKVSYGWPDTRDGSGLCWCPTDLEEGKRE